IHASAVAAGDFRIHPAQHHGAAVEGNDFAILRPTGVAGRTNVVFTAGAAFELQLLQRGAVGEIHHDAAVRTARDVDGLATLAAGRRRGTGQIGVFVKGAVAPTA